MRSRVLVVCFVALLCSPASAAAGEQERFEQANDLLTRGEAGQAKMGYEALREQGLMDAALEHNLGNACVRVGALGRAIGAYRRGLRLQPAPKVEEALRRNLEIVRRQLQDRYRSGDDGRQFIYADPGGLWYRLTHLMGSSDLTWLALCSWSLLWLLLSLRRLSARWGWTGPAAIPVAIIAALLFTLLWGQTSLDNKISLGVIVTSDASLKDGPHADARGVPVAEGMELRVLEAREAWSEVELAGGRRGWISKASIEAL
jgi:hypothetical protein